MLPWPSISISYRSILWIYFLSRHFHILIFHSNLLDSKMSHIMAARFLSFSLFRDVLRDCGFLTHLYYVNYDLAIYFGRHRSMWFHQKRFDTTFNAKYDSETHEAHVIDHSVYHRDRYKYQWHNFPEFTRLESVDRFIVTQYGCRGRVRIKITRVISQVKTGSTLWIALRW